MGKALIIGPTICWPCVAQNITNSVQAGKNVYLKILNQNMEGTFYFSFLQKQEKGLKKKEKEVLYSI